MKQGLLVTGTDTEVGKTLVTAGLCAWLKAQGGSVVGFKPVESGTEENGGVPSDAELLAACTGGPIERSNVYAMREPLAPVLAARNQGVPLEQARLDEHFRELGLSADCVVVEGVGGALVEVTPGITVADLARRWELPTLVVSANRLGVLSHSLLTLEALQNRGVAVAGLVLNTVHGGEPGLAEVTNPAELERLLPAGVPLLGTCPWIPESGRRDPAVLAAAVSGFAERLLGSLEKG